MDNYSDVYIKLFPSCKPVKGYRRGIICDLENMTYHLVPNSLIDLLELLTNTKLKDIEKVVEDDSLQVLNEYTSFVLDNNLGFITEDPVSFSDIETLFHHPSTISNAILVSGSDSQHDYPDILNQLDQLNCKGLELRFFYSPTEDELNDILSLAEDSRLQSIDLILKHSPYMNDTYFIDLVTKYRRLSYIQVHSAPFDHEYYIEENFAFLRYTSVRIIDNSFCGCISPKNFAVNVLLFTESLNFNNCLNKKIAIDEDGKIKNCPSMQNSHGTITNTKLKDVVENEEFRQLWGLTKDEIDICKDCEFRYICTDCRAFTEHGEVASKPSKCNYDPYNNSWRNVES
ncbi:grasp-with-spasm system SPASM domain peptide maturase [Olivibacter sp. CPCC 100613]|uniref:grasp-with-spasm system SPASM domain peptide maturase n=1 Tax=Olivibacter sp. CPCC 100613 TaxID=3079931 RepID=UPI002FF7EFAC